MEISGIEKPTLLLDESRCRRNIRKMAEKARLSGVLFRPHFKTHQSVEIGNWFRGEGVNFISVSSVMMAKHFARAGWNNITIYTGYHRAGIDWNDTDQILRIHDILAENRGLRLKGFLTHSGNTSETSFSGAWDY
jgi:D-serine deaminase-like pyridoxal phosphate-dependent protein